MAKPKTIHIGTSGWNYDHWQGPFYPDDLEQDKWLDYYCQHFNCVEINNSFYQLPDKKTLQHWQETVPDGFQFSMKASRYTTHMKKLKDPQDSTQKFFDRARELKSLPVILFQLPPRWNRNIERLKNFIQALPDKYRYTFEFRDQSWWHDEVYELLEKNDISFCLYELAGESTPEILTSDLVYIRLHGPQDAYQGDYHKNTLKKWRNRFLEWQENDKEIYCFFDNDDSGFAARNALELKELIDTENS